MAVLVAAVVSVVVYDLTPAFNLFDVPFYILAGERLLHGGGLDCLRTPAYPLFLQLCGWLGNMNAVATLLQSLLFVVSALALHDTCRRLTRHWLTPLAVTMFYVVAPAAGWANEMLTESLSVSLCVLLTNWVVRFLQRPSWLLAAVIALMATLMTLLRPNFVAFLVLLPALWAWQWAHTRERLYAAALLLCLLPIGGQVAYNYAFYRQFGVFASNISPMSRDYYPLLRSGGWHPEAAAGQEERAFVAYMDDAIAQGNPTYKPLYDYVTSTHDAAAPGRVLQRMAAQHRHELLRYRVRLVCSSAHEFMMPLTFNHTGLSAMVHVAAHFIAFPVLFLYHTVLLFAMALLVRWVRKRRLPVAAAFMCASVAAQVVGIALAGRDSFSRLLMPVLPVALLLWAIALERAAGYMAILGVRPTP